MVSVKGMLKLCSGFSSALFLDLKFMCQLGCNVEIKDQKTHLRKEAIVKYSKSHLNICFKFDR